MLLPLIFLFVANALGNLTVVLVSSIAYTLVSYVHKFINLFQESSIVKINYPCFQGIGLVAMSTPPVLANSTGTCKEYEPHCVGDTQRALLYTGMALIAVGMGGYNVSLRPLIEVQQDNPNSRWDSLRILCYILVVLVAVTGAIALPYINPWSLRFGIPAICTAFSTLLFFTGLCTYDRAEHVVSSRADQDTDTGVGGMIPMWIAFIMGGVVSSFGNTYFIEQAKHMNPKMGTWKVPTQILLLVFKSGKLFFDIPADLLLKITKKWVGIAVGIVFSVLCCITAALVEKRRLHVITSHVLLEKPDEDIPMSVYWLLFQFFLLSGLDSFLEKSIDAFSEDRSPESVTKLKHLSKGVCGVGYMCSVLSVYVVGRVSERGGGETKNWFQFSLNKSRLDRYYWVLSGLSSANLLLFIILVALCSCFGRTF